MENHSLFQIKVSEKIKNLRIEKGYSSYETFANDYEFDRKQYWRIENGSNITLKTLERILSIHEISAKDFFSNFEN